MINIRDSRGFTILELLLIMGITSLLLGIITINLVKVQHNTSISGAVDTLLADMKGQQIKAMSGASVNSASGDSYGVSFQGNKYVLFHGTTDPNDSTDFSVPLDTSITVSISPSNPLVFSQLSGEVCSSTCQYTITLTNTAGNETKIITVNRYGVVTNIQ
jgi:type II secretory pathway pseudopilin PulG